MKKLITHPVLIGSLALAFGSLLSSCVDPYAHGSVPHQTVTTYHPGYEVRTLPPGYRTEYIGGSNYYVHNGTYFRPRSGKYVVVEAPRTRYNRPSGHNEAIVTELPRGYRVVEYDGTRYYRVNDTYYQQRGSGYVRVGRPVGRP
ncbi:MAG: DUF6515 family protein [Verrucomicrobiota bacterium]